MHSLIALWHYYQKNVSMTQITFNQLPQAVGELIDSVKQIQSQLSTLSQSDQEEWMNLDQLVLYLPDKPSKATIYRKVRNREIPFTKRGKHLIFQRSKIDSWLSSGAIKTLEEIREESEENFVNKKRRANV